MKSHRCKVCAYICVNDLPDDYICPVCGVGKDQFEELHHMGEEQTGGEAQEKHVPVISGDETSTTVTVGSVEHPMTNEHHIVWAELHEGDKVLKKIELQTDTPPVAKFEGIPFKEGYKAIAFCNLHGLWES